jgi:hypothetical protein
MTDRLIFQTPYGDNLVARCDYCGKPVFKCTCEEDEDDCYGDDGNNGDYEEKDKQLKEKTITDFCIQESVINNI